MSNAPKSCLFPGVTSEWRGYERYEFKVDGRQCWVVPPNVEPAGGRPWIWRARFFDAWPGVDLALLEQGFHLAFMDVANLYGCPQAVAHWDAFYEYLTAEHGFAGKVALEGMSRGGLIVYNWASKNPDKVACIYADAPVCDIRSWPGGLGEGNGSPEDWARCLAVYGLTEETVADFRDNPIDHLEPLARAGVPLLHVCGDADESVPHEENTCVLEERCLGLGGRITVIVKPGCGHHPHSLEDPTAIVRFITRHTVKKSMG